MENKKNNILVLFAHPSQQRSEVNLPLFRMAKRIDGVTCVDLYAEYPTYHINIDREQQRLLNANIIIFQFPLYWYSTPSILKEWQDLVLEYGFAYGKHGDALKGKYFFCAVSAGGMEDAYKADGFNHFKLRELLRPLEQMANLTGMHYLPPFAIFGARTAIEDGKVGRHINSYRTLLLSLVHNKIDLDAFAAREKITSSTLQKIIKADNV